MNGTVILVHEIWSTPCTSAPTTCASWRAALPHSRSS